MHKLHVKIENLDSYESQDLVAIAAAYENPQLNQESFDHYMADVPNEIDRILNDSLADRDDVDAPSCFEITVTPINLDDYGSSEARSIDECPECHGTAKAEFREFWETSDPTQRYETICELVSACVSDTIALLVEDVDLSYSDLPSHVKPWLDKELAEDMATPKSKFKSIASKRIKLLNI